MHGASDPSGAVSRRSSDTRIDRAVCQAGEKIRSYPSRARSGGGHASFGFSEELLDPLDVVAKGDTADDDAVHQNENLVVGKSAFHLRQRTGRAERLVLVDIRDLNAEPAAVAAESADEIRQVARRENDVATAPRMQLFD